MAPKTKTVHTSKPEGGGRKDLLGQRKPFIKGLDNNLLYVGGALGLALWGASQGWFNSIIGGGAPSAGPVTVSASPNPDPVGTPVTATGSFNPSVPQAWWGVKNAQGALVNSGVLGQNVGSFSQNLGNYPVGNYTVEVSSDGPIVGVASAPQTLAINQQLASNYTPTVATQQSPPFGAPISGPENITLG